jgi:DNA invertase Pin-like site-specific DNA recombinase
LTIENQRRQYALAEAAQMAGFSAITIIDDHLGRSGSGSMERPGFQKLVALVCAGGIGAVYCIETSRLARNGRDWHHLIDLCALAGALVMDLDGIYDPRLINDRQLLGLKGTMSECELSLLRQRGLAARDSKAQRGELRFTLPPLATSFMLTSLNLIHQSLKSIRVAVHKLKQAGFADVIIATDHGFVLNAHAEAGDVCGKPAGVWTVIHDRALLGEGEPDAGNFAITAEKAGVRGDFAKLAGPRSMVPYRKGLLYFHGGASLQEAIVPVITVRLKQAKQLQLAAAKVALSYKNGAKRVRTRLPVVELAVEGENMFSLGETFEILLEAHNKKGDIIGEAKRGGLVEVATGTVPLKPGGKVQVTIRMAMEFEGKFTLKALNPITMAQYASLELETDYAV